MSHTTLTADNYSTKLANDSSRSKLSSVAFRREMSILPAPYDQADNLD
jgi:hypothetical protein